MTNETACFSKAGDLGSSFETVLDHVPGMVYRCLPDDHWTMLYASPGTLELTGFAPSELLSNRTISYEELIHPSDRQKVRQVITAAMNAGSRFAVEYRMRGRNGVEKWVREQGVAIIAQNGKTVALEGFVQDITAQQHSLISARDSEDRFRSIWEQSNEGMRLTDRAGTIVAVNEAYCQIVKLSRAELVGKPFSVTYYSQGPHDGMDVYTKRFDTGTIVPRFTTTARLWNGEEVGLDISNSFLEMSDGQRLIFTIFRDITLLKRAEANSAALAVLSQKLSAAKEAREAAHIILETAGTILGWDACNVSLYDSTTERSWPVLSLDTVEGKRLEHANSGESEEASVLMRSVIQDGARLILKSDPSLMTPGGTPFGNRAKPSASIAIVPIRNGETIIGVLAIHRYKENAYDNSSLERLQAMADLCGGALHRIRAQEALAASEAELRALFAAMTDVVLVLDRYGKYLQVAPTSANGVFGPTSKLVGRTVNEVLPPVEADQVMRSITQALELRKPIRIEYALEINGAPTWFEGNVSPLGKDRVFLIARNITDRKNLEEQVRQSQKMEAIGQLAGGVAHDFNNLLAVIRGNADLALMGIETGSVDARDCLQQITSAVDRAANLTRQLLVFGRKQSIQPRVLSINDVLINVTRMLKRIIGEHIELKCELGAGLPAIEADAGMLEQIVVNLAVNARDAMEKGGILTIGTAVEEIKPGTSHSNPDAREGKFVRLRVQDNGTGIAPEHLNRVFEPFFTTKSLGKGTGLGLATVYGIMKQHAGWVEVHSEFDLGSCFDVFFPAAARQQKQELASPEKQPVHRGTESILLVEDEKSVRGVWRRVLENHGYKVLEAASGPEALQICTTGQKHIDLLLTDMVMPGGLSGLELSRRLRDMQPELRVVIMSGYSSELTGKDTSFFYRLRHSFLQKPFTAHALLETLRRLLDEP